MARMRLSSVHIEPEDAPDEAGFLDTISMGHRNAGPRLRASCARARTGIEQVNAPGNHHQIAGRIDAAVHGPSPVLRSPTHEAGPVAAGEPPTTTTNAQENDDGISSQDARALKRVVRRKASVRYAAPSASATTMWRSPCRSTRGR